MKCCMILVRIDLGEGPKCIEEQLQAVKDEPENAGELVCLVCAYCGTKQYEECYKVVKDAIAKYPEDPRFYGYAGEANKTGKFLWETVSAGIEFEELVNAILDEYEIEEEVARKDAQAFVEKANAANLIEMKQKG